MIPVSRFAFVSSISSAIRWTGPEAVPEAPLPDPEAADNMGYAMLKWVAELITEYAGSTSASSYFPVLPALSRSLGYFPLGQHGNIHTLALGKKLLKSLLGGL